MSGAAPLPRAGLCATCRHAAVVASKRSRFLRCGKSETDLSYPRYPALPVVTCRGHELQEREGSESEESVS